MKILLDENIDNRIKDFLESENFEVRTTHEEELDSTPDKDIIDYALENGFAIITHDSDFLEIADETENHPTVIHLPQRTRFREMKKRLSDLPERIETENQIIHP